MAPLALTSERQQPKFSNFCTQALTKNLLHNSILQSEIFGQFETDMLMPLCLLLSDAAERVITTNQI